ncbi:glycosyltransferase [Hymenobacter edaphi]|uniref:Glycosyltransferase family 2 protein n=1 Tax=Hymenobacter edaphi TaxID=2211146 RepID=A0A328BQU1_9BACT|nr:glycosyltransferase [Hymenobacter edaphi]RAK69630.1 glycosyltransferase family 2 protein [Hymenobacter edaphi]
MNPAGLSVLIPVYNWPVEGLVRALLAQLSDWPGPAEILLLDDGSAPAFRQRHRPLAALPGVQYAELPRNVGRAAIRNQLAARAQYPWLLLLDNDSSLPDAQFLARYAAAAAQAPVLVGGTCYAPTPPAEATLRLRWHYGRQREQRPAARRQPQPYAQLTINNLLIQAEVLRRFSLDERLTRYGHEDTKFGWHLRAAGVPVLHLDNPVLHDGLEPAEVFLRKSRDAVRNLAVLYRAEGLGTDTRLLHAALRLRRLGLAGGARRTLQALEPRLRRQVLGAAPNLRALDLLKLLWLLQELT